MKLKHFFASALAVMAIFTACEETEDLGAASLTVSSEKTFSFDAETHSFTIDFVATRDWYATVSDTSWVVISNVSGAGTLKPQSIEVTILPNDAYSRRATVKLSIGLSDQTITIDQEGVLGTMDGSKDNPFNATAAREFTLQLDADVVTSQFYYVRGFVKKIVSIETSQYGNANFYITDTESLEGDDFYIFQSLGLGGAKFTSEDQLKVGDEVIVYAQFVNYKGNTPETNGKGTAKIYYLNGETKEVAGEDDSAKDGTPEGDGSKDNPFNATAAINAANALPADQVSTDFYYIKGFVKNIVSIETSQYGNANFYITDTAEGDTKQFYCFQVMGLGGAKFTSQDELKAGDEVVVYAQIVNYKGNTPETNGKGSGKIVSINGKEAGEDEPVGDPEGNGTEESPFNIAGALAHIQTLESGATDTVYVKGVISTISEVNTGDYGNAKFYISDDGTKSNEFYIYGCYYLNKEKFVSEDQIKVGDAVVLRGPLTMYYSTPEMTSGGYIVTLNGSSEGGAYFSVNAQNVSVGSQAGSHTIKISTNGEWTATSDNDAFTLSAASGEGSAELVVNYSENTSEEARVAHIVISTTADVATKSYTVTFSQRASGSSEPSHITWEASTDWDGVEDKAQTISYSSDGYTITVAKADGQNNPTVNGNANDCRAYAKATITITSANGPMSHIVFNISTNGLKRLAPVTADSGTVAAQAAGDKTVTWDGSAAQVVFTVGEKANYGSDGDSKAGQLCFDSIDIE